MEEGAQLFHVLNRGVDKRVIFLDDQDHFRFIHNLYEFNDENWVNTSFYAFNKSHDIESRDIRKRTPRKLIVDIIAFCIMPNHYHILLAPRVEGGTSKFMKKVNIGYAKYFNNKYTRTGTLFESRYKSVPVTEEAHFVYLPYYIHFNPLDLTAPGWREREIPNHKEALEFLEKYRWSSFRDYIGKKNFPSVITSPFLSNFLSSPEQYKKDSLEWLKQIDFNEISSITLE